MYPPGHTKVKETATAGISVTKINSTPSGQIVSKNLAQWQRRRQRPDHRFCGDQLHQ